MPQIRQPCSADKAPKPHQVYPNLSKDKVSRHEEDEQFFPGKWINRQGEYGLSGREQGERNSRSNARARELPNRLQLWFQPAKAMEGEPKRMNWIVPLFQAAVRENLA